MRAPLRVEYTQEGPGSTMHGISEMDESSTPNGTRHHRRLVAAYVTALAAALALIAYGAFSIGTRKEDWVAVADAMRAWGEGSWAPLLLMGAYYSGSLLSMPGLLMLTVLVTCLGPAGGALVAVTGTACSASTVHLIARRLGRGTVEELYPDQLAKIEKLVEGHSLLRVLQMRFLPVLPFHLVNAVCGLVGIPLSAFVAGTVLGLAPKMLVQLFFVRALLAGLTDAGTVMLYNLAVSLTLFVIVTITGLWMDRHIRRRSG